MDEVQGGILRVEQQAAVPSGAVLEVVLSWQFMADDKQIDLDTSCMIFNLAGRQLDCVFYNQLNSRDGSITHSGDHFTANCVGDTEIITIDTSKVHPDAQVIQILQKNDLNFYYNYKILAIIATCYSGGTFADVASGSLVLRDHNVDEDIVRMSLGYLGNNTALVFAVLWRDEAGGWHIRNTSQPGTYSIVLFCYLV